MAVALRQNNETSYATRQTSRSTRTRVRRRRRSRFSQFVKMIMPVVGVAMLFGWVAVYANVTVTGYNRSRLTEQCRVERLKNERLKVECSRLSSPHKVTAAAQRAGMIYATRYDYIHLPQSVASAEGAGR